jgi:hypothetical protein
MNKRERRAAQLLHHYKALEQLAKLCGVENPDGKKLSVALLKLEREAGKIATDYCNGDNGVNSENFDKIAGHIENQVHVMFGGDLEGFFINGDARGYALKLSDWAMRGIYQDIPLHRDWGGYGILAPEITGN